MREIDPKTTTRAKAFESWMKAPMPMATLIKRFDVSPLIRIAKRRKVKFNMLMCYCIGRAASCVKEFYLLPVGDRLMQFDRLAVNTIVLCDDGSINTCDLPYTDDLEHFNRAYLHLTDEVRKSNQAYELGDDYMVIGTSALTKCELEGVVNIYAGCFNNPFVAWGRYHKGLFRTTLSVSFQFHHTQMDGPQSTLFLNTLQRVINELR